MGMTQKETAEYISRVWKPMDATTLSKLTSNGDGPPFERKGHYKLFEKSDVDEWIDRKIAEAKADN